MNACNVIFDPRHGGQICLPFLQLSESGDQFIQTRKTKLGPKRQYASHALESAIARRVCPNWGNAKWYFAFDSTGCADTTISICAVRANAEVVLNPVDELTMFELTLGLNVAGIVEARCVVNFVLHADAPGLWPHLLEDFEEAGRGQSDPVFTHSSQGIVAVWLGRIGGIQINQVIGAVRYLGSNCSTRSP